MAKIQEVMNENVFTHVISSKVLEDSAESTCSRVILGKVCTSGDYDCLCDYVTDTAVETVEDAQGRTRAVRVVMAVPGREVVEVENLIRATGYQAWFGGDDDTVEATFEFKLTDNQPLRSLAS